MFVTIFIFVYNVVREAAAQCRTGESGENTMWMCKKHTHYVWLFVCMLASLQCQYQNCSARRRRRQRRWRRKKNWDRVFGGGLQIQWCVHVIAAMHKFISVIIYIPNIAIIHGGNCSFMGRKTGRMCLCTWVAVWLPSAMHFVCYRTITHTRCAFSHALIWIEYAFRRTCNCHMYSI